MQLVHGKNKNKKMHAFLLTLHGGSSAGDIRRKSNMNCCLSVHLRSGELKKEKKGKGKKGTKERKINPMNRGNFVLW